MKTIIILNGPARLIIFYEDRFGKVSIDMRNLHLKGWEVEWSAGSFTDEDVSDMIKKKGWKLMKTLDCVNMTVDILKRLEGRALGVHSMRVHAVLLGLKEVDIKKW